MMCLFQLMFEFKYEKNEFAMT